ncbi:MerR family transcriptional regulator [Virgisporangium aliadipatigenens]|uniref:MerR family transcriptional regulator n=1 Tax=Virgisporangium aliadipatigenens TaxID=741659 RepID=A0A8J4DVJ7_9ACTN|nr:MerR family transcriptional regulator [Virgisporangium aliadipatigenens]GIJ51879.1 MerR family transcriptional regulator [Virgisporangium aliadipatigenens]
MEELYPIGDVARRTGLTVSAIRYYSDEGIVRPAGLSHAGHRLYDMRAVAQLEMIRTLRDLGTGLDEIRRLVAGELSLRDLLAEHLELVERQERELRVRRAVLRALNREESPVEHAVLMHRLVSMPDGERALLVDSFWNEVGADLPADFVDRLRAVRPHLPDDPTAAQLAAWIELASLLRDPSFRDTVRAYLRETFATEPGERMTAAPMQEFIHSSGARIMERIIAAYRSGLPAGSAHAQELAVRAADGAAAAAGVPATAERRARLAAGYAQIAEIHRQGTEDDARFDSTHGRYLALVAAINGTPDEYADVDLADLGVWIAAALRASTQAGEGQAGEAQAPG